MIDFDALVIGPTVSTFGTTATYQPMTQLADSSGRPITGSDGKPFSTPGTPYTATGVFDEEYVEVTPDGRGPFPSTESLNYGAAGGITEARPVFGVQLSAMQTAPQQGDQLTIDGTTYVVREVQADGHGWAKLLLNLAGN